MLVADIITRVRNIAGDVNVLQFTDAQVLNWINDGIRECAIQNNLLQKRGTLALVANTAAYPLPADILKLHSIRIGNDKLTIKTLEEAERLGITDAGSGSPEYAYIWAGILNLIPAPSDVSDPLTIDYTYDPTDITLAGAVYTPAAPAIPVGYHARLVDYCLAQVAQQDDDLNRYTLKMQEFATGVSNLEDQPRYENDLYPSISVSDRDMGDWY